MKLLIKKKTLRNLSWVAVLLWMVLIFIMSAQPAADSSELSKGITELIVEVVERIAPGVDIDTDRLHYLIRRYAHFIVYLMLGILVMNAVRISGVSDVKVLVFLF